MKVKCWIWGPTTIWHNLESVKTKIPKSLHPTGQWAPRYGSSELWTIQYSVLIQRQATTRQSYHAIIHLKLKIRKMFASGNHIEFGHYSIFIIQQQCSRGQLFQLLKQLSDCRHSCRVCPALHYISNSVWTKEL